MRHELRRKATWGTRLGRLALIGLLGWLVAPAASTETKEEVLERMKARVPRLEELKGKGTIGETASATVEVVADAPDDVRALLNAENADRSSLFQLIAAEQQVSVETVAAHFARTAFERARSGEYLKAPDGAWRQKP